jgi:hypothetical protein
VEDTNIKKVKAKLAVAGIMALGKRAEYIDMIKDAVENDDTLPKDAMISAMLAERMIGFVSGISAASSILDGEDALDAFSEFLGQTEQMVEEIRKQIFSDEVEHYSETGEG